MADVERGLAVSVVIPVRDDAAELRRCLTAIGPQLGPRDEVVVVDNGSSDASAAVARAAGARVVTETRVGIPFAVASGYDAAARDVVVRCDADTRPGPHWLDRFVAALEEDPATVAVVGGADFALPRVAATAAGILYLGSYRLLAGAALAHPPLFGTTMAFRRTFWERARDSVHLDPGVHDDFDLSFAIRPGERVRVDRRNRVGMSARALAPTGQALRRARRGVRTVSVNFAEEPPWQRWRRFTAHRRSA